MEDRRQSDIHGLQSTELSSLGKGMTDLQPEMQSFFLKKNWLACFISMLGSVNLHNTTIAKTA